jgi:uncharacterized membrane protein
MNLYLFLKTLHIVSSVVLVGTGFGSAFYLFCINRSQNLAAQAEVAKVVVLADWIFTTPAVIFQPLSGYALIVMAGYSFNTSWVILSTILYFFAGMCWLPVVYLQLKMKKMAEVAVVSNSSLPTLYYIYARRWEYLGYPAFVSMLGVYYLMVNKPEVF